MTSISLLDRARACWTGLAGTPVQFPTLGRTTVVLSPGSLLCPPGWAGIVELAGAAIATVPAPHLVGRLASLDPTGGPSLARLRALVDVAEVLGPATLAYLDEAAFRPPDVAGVQRLAVGHPDVAALLATTAPDEAGESGIADLTSDAFVVSGPTGVTAVAGYRRWPGAVAHVSVLTAADRRGRGLARAVAAAAVADALAGGLLPQWRARVEPSRRVAAALGFEQLGAQLSVRLVA